MRLSIFDFDDTLFCTSYFVNFYPNIDFGNYGDHVEQTLRIALEYCDRVFIITNADIDWVFETCLERLPKLRQFIIENVSVISTVTSGFSENTPVAEWKIKAFDEKIGKLFLRYDNVQHFLLTFGDAPHDKTATECMAKYSNVTVRHVSFKIAPTLHDLFLQHIIVQNEFPQYFLMEKNIYDTFQ